jgi:hypothetical protein
LDASTPAAAAAEFTGPCVIFSGGMGRSDIDIPCLPPEAAEAAADVQIPQHAVDHKTFRRSSNRSRRYNASSSTAAAEGATAAAAPAAPGAAGAVDWPQLLQLRLQQLAGHAQPLPPVSVEACKAMNQHQLADYWRHHVYTSALLLQQLECAPNAAAAAAEAAIHDYRDTRFFSCFSIMVLNPAGTIRVAATDFSNDTEINPHELDEHWTQVVLGLQLTEQQQELLMTVFEMIGRDLLAISRQRKRLLGEMILATTAAAKVRAFLCVQRL